jgi:hypothetical protein
MSGNHWPDYTGTMTASATADMRKREVRLVARKWTRLTADDLAALESADDLVAMLVARYGLETAQARKIIDAAMRPSPR